MPRWLQITLTVAVYLVIMAGAAWVLEAWGRPAFHDLYKTVGGPTVWFILAAIIIPAGVYGYWPRRPDGTMRRLRSPWD